MGQFYAIEDQLTPGSGAEDLCQIRVPSATGSEVAVIIHEVYYFYRSSDPADAVRLDTVLLRRGSSGSGGTGLTEFEYNTGGNAAAATAFRGPSLTDIGTIDWEMGMGVNGFHAAHWQPSPRLRLQLAPGDHFALHKIAGAAQGIRFFVAWEEVKA